jgi:hypothetical protein
VGGVETFSFVFMVSFIMLESIVNLDGTTGATYYTYLRCTVALPVLVAVE